jgi:hypothetical protein
MRLGSFFWGMIIVMAGVLLALQEFNIIGNFWGFAWPLFLILLGGWFIAGVFFPRLRGSMTESINVDLGDAKKARLELSLGAGHVIVTSGAAPGQLLAGNSAGPVEVTTKPEGDEIFVQIEAGPNYLPFFSDAGSPWQFRLTNQIPLSINFEAGASRSELDLTDLQLTFLNIETGASSTTLKLPASGNPMVKIEAGASSLDITIPANMGARVLVEGGMSTFHVDPRFEHKSGGLYQSADYDGSAQRIDLTIEAGVGSIHIH